MDYTRKMLNEIRSRKNCAEIELPTSGMVVENDNLLNRFNVLMEEAEGAKLNNEKAFVIKNNDVQFGSVKSAQEDAIRKTVGDVSFKDDSLKYFPGIKDLVINGEITGIGVTFQFRYKDPSGDGCYVWADGLQLSDANTKTVEKIRDAFQNWKQSLVDDGDLMNKLDREANRNK